MPIRQIEASIHCFNTGVNCWKSHVVWNPCLQWKYSEQLSCLCSKYWSYHLIHVTNVKLISCITARSSHPGREKPLAFKISLESFYLPVLSVVATATYLHILYHLTASSLWRTTTVLTSSKRLSIQWYHIKRKDNSHIKSSYFVTIRTFFAIFIWNFTCLAYWVFLSKSNELTVALALWYLLALW
jgi:hypothetical protein